MGLIIAIGIVTLAVVLVVAFVVRQARRVREIEKTIDYSKVRRWDDEDDD